MGSPPGSEEGHLRALGLAAQLFGVVPQRSRDLLGRVHVLHRNTKFRVTVAHLDMSMLQVSRANVDSVCVAALMGAHIVRRRADRLGDTLGVLLRPSPVLPAPLDLLAAARPNFGVARQETAGDVLGDRLGASVRANVDSRHLLIPRDRAYIPRVHFASVVLAVVTDNVQRAAGTPLGK